MMSEDSLKDMLADQVDKFGVGSSMTGTETVIASLMDKLLLRHLHQTITGGQLDQEY